MNFTRLSVIALAVSTAFACNGKLEVGDKALSDAGDAGRIELAGSAGMVLAGSGGMVAIAGRPSSAGSSGTVNAGSGGTAGTAGSVSAAGVGGVPCPDFMFPCGDTTPTDQQIEYWQSFPRVPAVPGSSDGCPQGPLTPFSVCPTPAAVCGYRFDDDKGMQTCACAVKASGGGTWDCGGDTGDTVNLCPLEEPKDGSDCYGFYSLSCSYLWNIDCECSAETKVWSCVGPAGTPADAPLPMMPEPSKPVSDLSNAEQKTLCDWSNTMFGGGDGFPPIQDSPVDANGYTSGGSCIAGDKDFCPLSEPMLSKAQCVANLELSACKAPVQMLAECMRALFYRCTPADLACGNYLQTPNCPGTMLGEGFGPSSSACSLKVK
ncbi:MAG: hypothetical protein WDO69_10020 [Pseudomonadota bacterium]